MSAAFIVLATGRGECIRACEIYRDQTVAFDRAISLSKQLCPELIHLDWIDEDPAGEHWGEVPYSGDVWTFVDTSSITVSVIWTKCGLQQDIVSSSVKTNSYTLPSTNTDDPADRSLPGGWDYNNQPVTMTVLDDDPHSVKMTSELTEAQKWALVIARVNKRQSISILIPGHGTYTRNSILCLLRNKHVIGLQLRDAELVWLDQYLTAKRLQPIKD